MGGTLRWELQAGHGEGEVLNCGQLYAPTRGEGERGASPALQGSRHPQWWP